MFTSSTFTTDVLQLTWFYILSFNWESVNISFKSELENLCYNLYFYFHLTILSFILLSLNYFYIIIWLFLTVWRPEKYFYQFLNFNNVLYEMVIKIHTCIHRIDVSVNLFQILSNLFEIKCKLYVISLKFHSFLYLSIIC